MARPTPFQQDGGAVEAAEEAAADKEAVEAEKQDKQGSDDDEVGVCVRVCVRPCV